MIFSCLRMFKYKQKILIEKRIFFTLKTRVFRYIHRDSGWLCKLDLSHSEVFAVECYQLEAEIIFDKLFSSMSSLPPLQHIMQPGQISLWIWNDYSSLSLSLLLCFFSVPSASMTRLARSRTASLTSAGSVDGSRNRACTRSDSSEGVGQVSHTMEVSCWTLLHCLTRTHL